VGDTKAGGNRGGRRRGAATPPPPLLHSKDEQTREYEDGGNEVVADVVREEVATSAAAAARLADDVCRTLRKALAEMLKEVKTEGSSLRLKIDLALSGERIGSNGGGGARCRNAHIEFDKAWRAGEWRDVHDGAPVNAASAANAAADFSGHDSLGSEGKQNAYVFICDKCGFKAPLNSTGVRHCL